MVIVLCQGSQGSQCTLGATGLPPTVIAASLFRHTPSPWNCHFEYSTLVKINFIIWLNLVNLLWWRKENWFLFTQCVVLFICGPRTVGYLSAGPCLCRQPSASRQESPVGGVDGWDQDEIPGAALPPTVLYTVPLAIKIWYKVIYNLFLIADRESIFFNSHNVSKPESSSVLTAVSTLGFYPCSSAGNLSNPFLWKC